MGKEWLDFSGKVVLITGASRGIGETCAREFARLGAKLALASRKQDALDEVAAKIKEEGGEAFAVSAHVGKDEDRKRLVQAVIERYGKIDILVNNAATNPIFGPIMNAEEEAWDKIFEVNVKGPFFLSKEVAKEMAKQKKGVIVNIASVAGIKPMMGLGVYSVSKAALLMLSRVLSAEWGDMGIRVNAVAPGVIKTRFSEALWKNDFIRKVVEQSSPLGRIGETNDVVGAVIFLASDASNYLTGSVIVVDGGVGLKGA